MNLSKFKEEIKSFFLNISFKEISCILFYFIVCYISMILLNGNDLNLKSLVIFSNQWLNNFTYIFKYIFSFSKFIYNFAIFISLYLIIYAITNRPKISCIIISTLTIVFSILNYTVRTLRGAAITFPDIFSIRTALNVVNGMKLHINHNFIVAVALFIISTFAFCFFVKFKSKRTIISRVIAGTLGIVGMVILFINISHFEFITDEETFFNINNTYERLGANVTIIKMICDLQVEKPKNYSHKEVENILEKFPDDTQNYNGNLPNVIVVLNESFADITNTYNCEDITEDNIKYFHELINEENVVSGIVHSSWFGYGTSNVEYEFLTQNSTVFLPNGSVPFQQYITKNVNQSIVEYMNGFDYNTYGIHSYYKTGYNRFKVYDLLNFKNKVFFENMNNLSSSLNEYPSDSSTYNYWYDIMSKKPKDEKNFSFILTIQNHVPYNKIDTKKIKYSTNRQLNSYMQVEEDSDKALKELIDFIKVYDENTILLFFGDHQPYLNILENMDSNFPKEEVKYIIPFVIFANFDIEEQSNIEISTNYLQSLLLDVAKMPMNSYTKYISELRKDIPVITAQYYKDNNGNLYNINDKSSPLYEKIQEYWKIIYYQMFEN